jgi:hypothetical protein
VEVPQHLQVHYTRHSAFCKTERPGLFLFIEHKDIWYETGPLCISQHCTRTVAAPNSNTCWLICSDKWKLASSLTGLWLEQFLCRLHFWRRSQKTVQWNYFPWIFTHLQKLTPVALKSQKNSQNFGNCQLWHA